MKSIDNKMNATSYKDDFIYKKLQTIPFKEPSSCLYNVYDVLKIASSFKHYFHLVISNIGQKAVNFVWQNTYGANLDFQINYCLPQYNICVIIVAFNIVSQILLKYCTSLFSIIILLFSN